MRFAGRAILLDIEGTIAPISFVYDVLFPFARRELRPFLERTWDAAETRAAVARVAADAGVAGFTLEAIVPHLLDLMDRDVKATGLKELQGLIWKRGYESGELRSNLFDDVPPALRAWHARGIDVRIYSSGSVAAQKLFLSHTEFGDLTSLLRGYYDTTTGPKTAAASYLAIARDMGARPDQILFVSDMSAELDAAAAAGFATALAVRPGNRPVAPQSAHPRIERLDATASD